MKYVLPTLILITGILFTIYQFKNAEFKPVISYKYANLTLMSKEGDRHLFMIQRTRHVETLVLNCSGSYNIGEKVKVVYRYVDGIFSKTIC